MAKHKQVPIVLAHLSCTPPLLSGSLFFSEKESAGKFWVFEPFDQWVSENKKTKIWPINYGLKETK
jgi:hypothetical protein